MSFAGSRLGVIQAALRHLQTLDRLGKADTRRVHRAGHDVSERKPAVHWRRRRDHEAAAKLHSQNTAAENAVRP